MYHERGLSLSIRAKNKVADLPEASDCRSDDGKIRRMLLMVVVVVVVMVMVMVAEVTPSRHTGSYSLCAVGQVDSCNTFSHNMCYWTQLQA